MIQEEIEQFKMLAPAILPELFDSVSITETDIDEESATISYALSHQYDLEDVMDKFEDQMELTILYHFIPSAHTDFGHQCCAYSDTQFGHMFKIHASTNASGKVETLTVTVYDSLDAMCTDLMEDLDRHENRGKFVHKVPKEDLLVELALIRRIADIINERRTWINAELSPKQTPYLIPLDGTISVCYSCSLNLQVIEARNGYKKNQKWIIPEVVLERTFRS